MTKLERILSAALHDATCEVDVLQCKVSSLTEQLTSCEKHREREGHVSSRLHKLMDKLGWSHRSDVEGEETRRGTMDWRIQNADKELRSLRLALADVEKFTRRVGDATANKTTIDLIKKRIAKQQREMREAVNEEETQSA